MEENQEDEIWYSRNLMDPETGISYEEPAPNTFSFNSPYGACPHCKGLGTISEVDLDLVIPDKNLSINSGGFAPLGDVKDNYSFTQLKSIAKKYGFSLSEPIKNINQRILNFLKDLLFYELKNLTSEIVKCKYFVLECKALLIGTFKSFINAYF
jgi:excinuclease ABC subunit A